jgi:hypothetical protein
VPVLFLKDVKLFMKYSLLLVLVVLTSCSLFNAMRKNSFAYADHEVLPLLVPKDYKNVELKADNAGNKTCVFSYEDGGALYFYYGDTTKNNLFIDTSMNIPKYYPENVQFYKGLDSSNGLFWRESQYKNFRFGYRNITTEREALFDSSVNYAAWQAFRK